MEICGYFWIGRPYGSYSDPSLKFLVRYPEFTVFSFAFKMLTNEFEICFQDFVPYVVRVAKLLLQKSESVHPMNLKEGEPQLTMTSIFSLDDLTPFFAAICESVTKQQTKGQKRKLRRSATRLAPSDTDLINSIIEQDFLETVAKQ